MHSENQLIQAFTGKTDLHSTSIDQWTGLIEKYPAFNLGYYFRTKSVVDQKTEVATEFGYQAARYFNDIRWLDYLLKTGKPTLNDEDDKRVQKSHNFPEPVLVTNQVVGAPMAFTQTTPPESETTTGSLPQKEQNIAEPLAETDTEGADARIPRISEVLSAQLADFKKPVAKDAQLEVQREPLYKVDYFASQGISILKPQDGFEKKVRKFTDWLKEMKQQSPSSAPPQLHTTPQEEAQAAQKAANSLKIDPIWTESMAEVLENQGKTAQAKEVYKKLSLLYPEKSTYFASKIDLLQ